MLYLRRIEKDDPLTEEITRINEEAFPPVERMTVGDMFGFTEKFDSAVWGIFRGEEFAGFAMTAFNDRCAYFFYLAIDRKFRNQGLGLEALKAFFREFSGRQVILDFEVPDPAAENYPLRIRRKNFYLRSGFHETGHFTMFRGERYEVVCTGEELETESFRDLAVRIHEILPAFPPVLL